MFCLQFNNISGAAF